MLILLKSSRCIKVPWSIMILWVMLKTLSSTNRKWLLFLWSHILANCLIQLRRLRNLQKGGHQRWRKAQRESVHQGRVHRMPFQLLATSKVTNNWLWILINQLEFSKRKVNLKCKLKMWIWRLKLKRKLRSKTPQRREKLKANLKQPKKLKSHLKLIQIEEGAWTNADDHPDLAHLSSSKSWKISLLQKNHKPKKLALLSPSQLLSQNSLSCLNIAIDNYLHSTFQYKDKSPSQKNRTWFNNSKKSKRIKKKIQNIKKKRKKSSKVNLAKCRGAKRKSAPSWKKTWEIKVKKFKND